MNNKVWTKTAGPNRKGRKPGSINKLPFHKVVDVLMDKGLNPTVEILKLLPELSASEQVKTWLFLITYTQSRPTTEDTKTVGAMEAIAEKVDQISDEEFLRAIRNDTITVK